MTFPLNKTLARLCLSVSVLCTALAVQAADIKPRSIKFAMQNAQGSA